MCMKKRTAGQFASRFLLNCSSGAGGPSASLDVSLTRTIAAVMLEVERDIFTVTKYTSCYYLPETKISYYN